MLEASTEGTARRDVVTRCQNGTCDSRYVTAPVEATGSRRRVKVKPPMINGTHSDTNCLHALL